MDEPSPDQLTTLRFFEQLSASDKSIAVNLIILYGLPMASFLEEDGKRLNPNAYNNTDRFFIQRGWGTETCLRVANDMFSCSEVWIDHIEEIRSSSDLPHCTDALMQALFHYASIESA